MEEMSLVAPAHNPPYIKAMRLLAAAATWEEKATLPDPSRLPEAITALASQDFQILNQGQQRPGAGRTLEARFTRHRGLKPSLRLLCFLLFRTECLRLTL